MDKHELENWQRIKDKLEETGNTDSFFYKRAVAICGGQDDPWEKVTKGDG